MFKAIGEIVMRQTFADFESFVNSDNTIRIGRSVSELSGNGTEYLLSNGQVIAKFFNGNFVGSIPKMNSDLTVSVA